MERSSDNLISESAPGYDPELRSALRSPAGVSIRQRVNITAIVLAVTILLILLANGLVLLPSLGSPLHLWSDFALLSASVFLVIAAGALWINRIHLSRHHKHLQTFCAMLERSMASRSRLLAESNSMLMTLFNAFQERVVIVDRDARIVQANRFATAQAGSDPVGQMFSDVFPSCDEPAERRCEIRQIQRTFADNEPQRGRLIRGGPQCQSLLSIDTYPVRSPNGIPEMVIEIARDVTRQVEQDMRHHHQEKMAALGMLAASFAHDLGNPLASLSSELQLLVHEHDATRIRDSLSVLNTHVNRIARNLHDILDFARRRSSQMGDIDLSHAVHDALRLVKYDPRAQDIAIETDIPDELPPVLISEDDLLLVLINIIFNAFDAMPAGGKLLFRGELAAPGQVRLLITDTGIGMDEALVRNAVKVLYTTREKSGGTGLGLPLCIDIMKNAGGRLDIQSTPGHGTRIALEFALAGSLTTKEEGANDGEQYPDC